MDLINKDKLLKEIQEFRVEHKVGEGRNNELYTVDFIACTILGNYFAILLH